MTTPLIVILVSPSGGGKDTILKYLLERMPNTGKPITATTRAPREGDIEGVTYHFHTRASFERMLERGELAEHADVHGNLYGCPVQSLADVQSQGKHALVILDYQGARSIKAKMPEAVWLHVLPPSGQALYQRLIGRGTESEAQVRERIHNAEAEIMAASEADAIVYNDNLEEAVTAAQAVIERASLGEPLDRPRGPMFQALLKGLVAGLREAGTLTTKPIGR